MLQSTDAATGRRVVELADQAGIPIFLSGIPVAGSKPTAALNVDFAKVGRLIDEWVAQQRPRAKVGIVAGLPGAGPSDITLKALR